MSFTPGPWEWGEYHTTGNFKMIEKHVCVCLPESRLLIAACGPAGDKASQDDARLIAAAPELLEALEAAKEELEILFPTGQGLNTLKVWRKATLAIAKARGMEA